MTEFDWREYLALAQHLAESDDSGEAEHRAAVSRAYYAALNVAQVLLSERFGFVVDLEKGSTHVAVWMEIEHKVNPKAAILGRTLKNSRRWADYENAGVDNWQEVARTACAQAVNCIELLDR